jgi:SAM-dependent methyltransferase
MAVMSAFERWACVNPLWRGFSARIVIRWVFADHDLAGDVLELGTGAGANAASLLDRYPHVRLVATDVDPAMLDAARVQLRRFGERVMVQPVDAAAIAFDDDSFDAVVTLLMLHHVGDWRAAVAEVARVLRPGGWLVGYDLTASGPAAWLHRGGRPGHILVATDELRDALAGSGFADVRTDTALGGLVGRFAARVAP